MKGMVEWFARLGKSDEEWIEQFSVEDDETWASQIKQDFGLDVRPYLGKTPSGIVDA